MRAGDLVATWAAAADAPPERAALTVLAGVGGVAVSELISWPSGRCDAALLAATAEVASGPLAMTAACPACGERVEAHADVADLLADAPADHPDRVEVTVAGRVLHVRAPSGADLAAAGAASTVEAARDLLLAACAAGSDGRPVTPGELAPDAVAAVADAVAALDPQAAVEVALACPGCGHAWGAMLDAGAFLLAAADARARALLDDVHRLAGAYGWSHGEVLALPDAVRRHYLALVA